MPATAKSRDSTGRNTPRATTLFILPFFISFFFNYSVRIEDKRSTDDYIDKQREMKTKANVVV